VRALRRLTVRVRLPEPLAALSELVLNLRWSWHPETIDLFESVEPTVWRDCRHDPVRLLGEVPPGRLEELATDDDFLRRLGDAAAELEAYVTTPGWYQGLLDAPQAIAYFSPEFGITETLPQYSGGLGILAGDHLKAASDLGVPIIGVGLLYRAGYFVQSLSADGWQLEHYPGLDPHGLPLTQLRDAAGDVVNVGVGVPGRTMWAHVWKAQVGRVPLLLLDTDLEDNEPGDRSVTDRLYGGASDHRLLQEMLLGIGGVRAVRAWCAVTGAAQPEVFHTNEGHAGFQGVERIREYVLSGLSFDEGLTLSRAGTVFTTHTPVPAGIDRFPRELVERHLGPANPDYAELPEMPLYRILAFGAEDDPTIFNMAHKGLRLAQRANGVSRLHGQVSREMFNGLWPGFDAAEVPIGSITNGVHAPTWVARPMRGLAELESAPRPSSAATELSDEQLVALRRELRSALVDEVRRRVRVSWEQRGASPAELGWVDDVFDPSVLTIGFARRVPSYKRLTLMLSDPERLTRLLLDPQRPIQLVIAGKAHPADNGGKELVQQIVRFADGEGVRHRMVFLPDYDIGMARFLYAGCDVWLNNPLRPLEACGTSGMKSALNGGLNLSIRDGWWDEMFDGQNGWAIPTADGVTDPVRRDNLEAAALYDLIENTVTPRFYERPSPIRWVGMVRHTLLTLGPKVLASRMLRDYVNDLYVPAGRSARAVSANNYAGARELAAWRQRVIAAWPSVTVGHVDAAGAGDTPSLGSTLHVRAVVSLGPLTPQDVIVQAVYGRVDESDQIIGGGAVSLLPARLGEAVAGGEGVVAFEGDVPLASTGPFGYAVRVLPYNPLLATPVELGLIAVPSARPEGEAPPSW
jgi:glycogen phosphorylase